MERLSQAASHEEWMMQSFILLVLLLIGFEACSESFIPPRHIGSHRAMASTNDHDALSVLELSPIGIGFVGCGTIASAIATGICSFAPSIKIMVSRRSESQSARLQATFPNQITVRDENQEIVDQSDVIFLCVLPQQTSEILQSLKFDPNRHRLVSLVVS
jgi:NADP oxidoreductase coenzyme F420-dependent